MSKATFLFEIADYLEHGKTDTSFETTIDMGAYLRAHIEAQAEAIDAARHRGRGDVNAALVALRDGGEPDAALLRQWPGLAWVASQAEEIERLRDKKTGGSCTTL